MSEKIKETCSICKKEWHGKLRRLYDDRPVCENCIEEIMEIFKYTPPNHYIKE